MHALTMICSALALWGCIGSAPDDATDKHPRDVTTACTADTAWVCDCDGRSRCESGIERHETCERGCLPSSDGDAVCVDADPAWSCASSSYQGHQYWTCDPGSGELHRCDADGGVVATCETGCVFGPLGTDDACRPPGTDIALPDVSFVISGGLVAEAQVRALIVEGLRRMLALVEQHLVIDPGASLGPITLYLSVASQSYCSGLAAATSAQISCPLGYPVSGDNQNYIVNISVHEIGHVVARQLLNAQAHVDNCENEGLATWLATSYWANYRSMAVGSLRQAARDEIDAGRATATMTTCILASDPYYKVYGSFFEYLATLPGSIERITSGASTSAPYLAGWHAWLGR